MGCADGGKASMKAGDLVETLKGNLALIASVDEIVTDQWEEEQLQFVTLIYCDTGVKNRYCDARYLKLIQRGDK